MNFEQILNEKIKAQNIRANFGESSESLDPQGIDPAHLAYLMGQISRTHPPSKASISTLP